MISYIPAGWMRVDDLRLDKNYTLTGVAYRPTRPM